MSNSTRKSFCPPERDCHLCPRLVELRQELRAQYPDWHNGPVDPFGDLDAALLIIGLAPGMKGANRTGRPFTADYAGDLLYETLIDYGFAKGRYERHAEDGLELINCRITNAVRCLPPANKPTGDEEKTCRPFLVQEIAAMNNLRVVMVLGHLAHRAILATMGLKQKDYRFGHGAVHHLPDGKVLINSYHCSRYNTQTRRLTTEMFRAIVALCKDHINS